MTTEIQEKDLQRLFERNLNPKEILALYFVTENQHGGFFPILLFLLSKKIQIDRSTSMDLNVLVEFTSHLNPSESYWESRNNL